MKDVLKWCVSGLWKVVSELGQCTKPGAPGVVLSVKHRTLHKIKGFFKNKTFPSYQEF